MSGRRAKSTPIAQPSSEEEARAGIVSILFVLDVTFDVVFTLSLVFGCILSVTRGFSLLSITSAEDEIGVTVASSVTGTFDASFVFSLVMVCAVSVTDESIILLGVSAKTDEEIQASARTQ